MPKSWYLFNPPQVLSSGFERDEFLEYGEDSLAEVLEESFLGVDVVLYMNGTLDKDKAIKTKAIVQGNSPTRNGLFDSRQIICYSGTLKIGNYVGVGQDIYLITELPGNNQIYDFAWMNYCNYPLRWINDNGDIIERPCYLVDSTRYSSGELATRDLVLGNIRIELFLPKDSETIKLTRRRRFIVDDYEHAQINLPVVYKITKPILVERRNDEGAVFKYIMAEDAYNASVDNRALMIADYWSLVTEDGVPTPIIDRCLINFDGKAEIKAGGLPKTLSAEFYDIAGNLFSDVGTWLVFDTSGSFPTGIEIKSQTTDNIQLACKNDINLIGKLFYVKLTDSNNNTDTLEIRIVGLG